STVQSSPRRTPRTLDCAPGGRILQPPVAAAARSAQESRARCSQNPKRNAGQLRIPRQTGGQRANANRLRPSVRPGNRAIVAKARTIVRRMLSLPQERRLWLASVAHVSLSEYFRNLGLS